MQITQRGTDAILVGILLVVVDFQVAAGVDVVADVAGWVLIALGLARLLERVQGGPTNSLWRLARAGAWGSAVLAGVLSAVGIGAALGISAPLGLLTGRTGLLIVVGEIVLGQLVIAALGRGGQQRASAWSAAPALPWLKAGWITALVVAGAFTLLGANALLSGALLGNLLGTQLIQTLLRIAALVSGALVGFGIAKARNEGALD